MILFSCTLKLFSLFYFSIEEGNKKAPSAFTAEGALNSSFLYSLEREPDSEPEYSRIENPQILIEVGRSNTCLFLQ